MTQLKERQEKFCQNYVLHRNATKAAQAAGYSEGSAHNQGYRLLQEPKIQERIEELANGITTDVDVISEIEKQYEVARNAGHTNSALKALELLAKVRGNNSEDVEVDTDTLEGEIVSALYVIGFQKAFELLERAFPEQFEDESDELLSEELSGTTDAEAGSNDDT